MKYPAFEFAQQVDDQLKGFNDKEYFMRKGRCKILREELLPLSRLGLHFKQPGVEVEVEAYENNDPADGTIRVSGFNNKEFDVQITHGFDYQDALRDELIVKTGACPGAGPIQRNKATKEIEAKTIAVDVGSHIEAISYKITELYEKKSTSFSYGKNMALIISFDEFHMNNFYQWSLLFSSLQKRSHLNTEKFIAIYLFNEWSCELYNYL